ncbi:C4-dicarboxylate transporter DctA [Methylomonas sp. EFPC3]|uniref:C4-dicarboxylate transporter DctA n=1 Tax=Methylomonas sp. EFPC3 TaxID=3021710 RepID=UPI00241608FB|nr:C4-dicarboxylate transporter DctA [Methylomonas sp. EFPC3]WFP52134.1 C4-dicarboxylate transporter DctA [Methylomonas sp. EFPC3]
MTHLPHPAPTSPRLYLAVLAAIVCGALFGALDAGHAVLLKPIGDAFIGLVKMLIGPVIFCTIVLGIAGAEDMKKAGRIGIKALLYFEIVSTFALGVGLLLANLLKPGAGFNADPATLDPQAVAGFVKQAAEQRLANFLLHIIPKTFTDAFTGSGDLLQVLLVSTLFGFALQRMGAAGRSVHRFVEESAQLFFAMLNLVMKLAPLGAGAAMAFTVGKYGIAALKPLAALMGCFYLSCVLFIGLGLGSIAALTGFNLFKLLSYLRAELLIVLGTSSSESALPPLMQKLERLGCSRSVVGLVVPAGYSFNLDGTNIYLTMAALFMAQALNIELPLGQQLSLLLVAMLTSKGASGVSGAGFITLAATLSAVPAVPVAALSLILGIDRFMSEARALTNLIGNAVAAIVISDSERELDRERLQAELNAGRGRAQH